MTRAEGPRRCSLALAALLVAAAALGAVAAASPTAVAHPEPAVAHAPAGIVRDGHARFQVITPTLIRLEYAADGRFEDRPTQTAVRTDAPAPPYRTFVRDGWRVIRTAKETLRWKRGGPFSAATLRLTFTDRGKARTVRPTAGAPHRPLGGWTRALDVQSGPVPLNPGVLNLEGWNVLDDSATALLTKSGAGFAVRPKHTGTYDDWYLFGFGHDFAGALRDLHTLTGSTPLLPRSAFGVWFSKYYAFSAADVRALVAKVADERVPLDTFSLDTDFKTVHNAAGAAVAAVAAGAPGKPFSWNAWGWNTKLFPDPAGFLAWAHRRGLSIAANIHPSIDSNDPRYAATVAAGGPLTADNSCRLLQADPTGTCYTFDWTNARQLAAYFALHRPFAKDGVDLFWFDWCCEGAASAVAPGLTPDAWINAQYAKFQHARGTRWPAFGRIGAGYTSAGGVDGDRGTGAGGMGAYAEHRSTIQFTGDTCATWSMLAFEAQMTAAESSIGLPYVSHDIGSFNGQPVNGQCQGVSGALSGAKVPADLYARWVQLGTFQPLDRLHSNHGKRLPWEYPAAADRAASDALRLREALVPYTYTAARDAVGTGLPIAGPLYLRWPGSTAAFQHPSEFTFGRDMVVAPVTTAGDPAPVTLWVPPGRWVDRTTGQRFVGPAVRTLSVPLGRIPVLVRAGSVVPTQPYATHTTAAPARSLVLTAYPGSGSGRLYDDAGAGFGYAHGRATWTTFRQHRSAHRVGLTIGAARGTFTGAPVTRQWEVDLEAIAAPTSVLLDGVPLPRASAPGRRGWRYDAAHHRLVVWIGAARTDRATTITVFP